MLGGIAFVIVLPKNQISMGGGLAIDKKLDNWMDIAAWEQGATEFKEVVTWHLCHLVAH